VTYSSSAIYVWIDTADDNDITWCYLKPMNTVENKDKSSLLSWEVATIYGPMWISWLLSLSLYLASITFLRRMRRKQALLADGNVRAVNNLGNSCESTPRATPSASLAVQAQLLYFKFTMIPLSFLVLRMPGTILRLLEFEGSTGTDGWQLAMAIGDPSQGWVNAVIFIASSPALQQSLIQMCRCCSGEQSSQANLKEADGSLNLSGDTDSPLLGTHSRGGPDGWSLCENDHWYFRSSVMSAASDATCENDYPIIDYPGYWSPNYRSPNCIEPVQPQP